MRWLLGSEERPSVLWLSGIDRWIIGLPLVLCLALWATSTQVLVMASRHDGGRVLSCHYFTGARVVQWQYAGAVRQGCPLVHRR